MARGFKIADAYVEVHIDKDTARKELAALPSQLGPEMDRAGVDAGKRLTDGIGKGVNQNSERIGRDAGGKISQGLNQSIVRNSPLIVAAIAGALSAGAPAAIAGATVLFAGIGAVAVAQNAKVRSSFTGLWEQIKRGAQSDSTVLVDVFARMATKIGSSFERMRPQIRDAFTAAAPIVDKFTDSVTKAAENALPGLVRAVQGSGPVMAGFGSFLEDIGTGLSDFFDKLTEHSPAAGVAFAALGDIIGSLLPILGELLGQGSELAAIILPPLADILEVVAGALDSVGGALPAVVAGFSAMKVVTALSGGLENIGKRLANVAAQGGIAAGAAGRLGSGFTTAGAAIGGFSAAGIGIAAVIAGWITNMQHAKEEAESMATAMIKGGDAARNTFDQTSASILNWNATWVDRVDGFFTDWVGSVPVLGTAIAGVWDLFTTSSDEAATQTEAAYRRMLEAMSPLQRAQAEATHWTNELAAAQGNSSYVLEDMNGNTVTLAEAQGRLAVATQEAARLQAELDQQASGMSRTLEQAATAAEELAGALDALNGGQLSLNEANRSYQEDLRTINELLAKNGQNLDIATQAGSDNQAALDAFAESANNSAKAIYNQTGSYDQFSVAMVNGRNALYDSAVAFGMSDAAARAYVDSVLSIPPITAMDIETNTPQIRAELDGMVERLTGLPVGQALVTWASPEVIQILSQLGYDIVGLPNGEVSITATDQTTPITDEVLARMGLIDQTVATSTIDADNSAFTDISQSTLNALGIVNGAIAVPQISADAGPFNAAAYNVAVAIANIAMQRPTPVASMNAAPLQGTAAGAFSVLGMLGAQRPTPAASLIDGVSGPARAAAAAINAIQSRTVTITTINRSINEVQNIVSGWGAMDGGSVDAFMAMANRRDGGGSVIGRGGPRDDMIPALLGGRVPFRLSNGEHVLDAMDVNLLGGQAGVYAFRAALNRRQAQVVMPTGVRRDGGGEVTTAGSVVMPSARTLSQGGARTIHVENLTVKIEGSIDLSDRAGMRRFGTELREVLIQLEREAK